MDAVMAAVNFLRTVWEAVKEAVSDHLVAWIALSVAIGLLIVSIQGLRRSREHKS